MPACRLLANGCGHGRGGGQQPPAFGQRLPTKPVGKEAEVTNADKARGQDMQKEATQKLSGGERHRLLYAAMSVVLPLKSDVLSIKSRKAVIGNRDAMRVAAEITQD